MLRFVTVNGIRSEGWTRREWLRLGLPGLLASLPARSGSRAGSPLPRRARSVLVVFASGGQSQLDTWDPKPSAPAEIRGAFRPISTSVPGIHVCEHLPRVARLAHLLTILRSVSHDDLDHGSAVYLSLTGVNHARKSSNPPPRPTDHPCLGAVAQRVRPAAGLPFSAVHLNGPLLVPETIGPGQFAGLLGRRFEPLGVGDVTREGSELLESLDPAADLPPVRVQARRRLLDSLDAYRSALEQEITPLRQQAWDLLSAPRFRLAFDLEREPAVVREAYGLHRSGQACLLGRRLVEAGVPFVTVFFNHTIRGQDKAPGHTDSYGWDTHNDIFEALEHHLLPRFDQTFATLLQDLEQRGLLDSTLVVCLGEFGRAPRVALEKNFAGSTPGRKHWAAVYSIVAAGAGVARGGVLGSSDRLGAYPRSHPISPADVAATLFAALGIDPEGHFRDSLDRPYRISEGKPIQRLFG